MRGVGDRGRLLVMVDQAVEHILEGGLLSVRVGATVYLLDKDDRDGRRGAVRLLAKGHPVTPTMLPIVPISSPP